MYARQNILALTQYAHKQILPDTRYTWFISRSAEIYIYTLVYSIGTGTL